MAGRSIVRMTITKTLHQHGVKVSMPGKGNYYDNATVETVFKTIKAELISLRIWEPRQHAEMAIFAYINAFYSLRLCNSALAWKSLVASER